MSEQATQAVEERIDTLKGTKATGARKGIRKVAKPATKPRKAPKPASELTEAERKARAKRAAYMREYRKRPEVAERESRRRKARRRGTPYVYMPSIRQAKDMRSMGHKLEQYRAEVTSSLANYKAQINDADVDIALQEARRPSGERHMIVVKNVRPNFNQPSEQVFIDPKVAHQGLVNLARLTEQVLAQYG